MESLIGLVVSLVLLVVLGYALIGAGALLGIGIYYAATWVIVLIVTILSWLAWYVWRSSSDGWPAVYVGCLIAIVLYLAIYARYPDACAYVGSLFLR